MKIPLSVCFCKQIKIRKLNKERKILFRFFLIKLKKKNSKRIEHVEKFHGTCKEFLIFSANMNYSTLAKIKKNENNNINKGATNFTQCIIYANLLRAQCIAGYMHIQVVSDNIQRERRGEEEEK